MTENKTSSAKNTIKILVVDDHPAIFEGLTLLLASEGINVCANANNIDDAIKHADKYKPDMAIVDLSLGKKNGLNLVAILHKRGIPIVVYSMHEDAMHVDGAITAGALGYVTKREFNKILVEAIYSVIDGRRFISPNAAIEYNKQPESLQYRNLSDQERHIFQLLSNGDGTQQIAELLGISTRTVESYYARIQDKLDINSMRDLRRYAINNRIK